MAGRILVSISFAGFLFAGFLLLTNHFGVAIQVSNYAYLPLLAGVLYEYVKK